MHKLKSLIRNGIDFFARYPAVLSGYIIYAYLFVSIMRLFFKVKFGTATLTDAYDIFSALPFMWLLSVALVKVIDFRSKLHETKTQILLEREQLRLKETQLNTMKEVVKGLQHHVNNPLAVIFLVVGRLKRKLADVPAALDDLDQVDQASRKISTALADFSAADTYEVEYVEKHVGTIAVPPRAEPSE